MAMFYHKKIILMIEVQIMTCMYLILAESLKLF